MKKRETANPYVTVLLSCLVIFVYGMLSSLLGTIIPELAAALHLTNSQIGYVALAQGLGLAATSVVAGALMDKRHSGCSGDVRSRMRRQSRNRGSQRNCE
jgi:fucose permease